MSAIENQKCLMKINTKSIYSDLLGLLPFFKIDAVE